MTEYYRMEDGEFTVIVPMQNEYESFLRAEPDVATLDKAVNTMIVEKMGAYEIAQHLFIAETLGQTDKPILGTPLVVLKVGAARKFSDLISSMRHKVTLPNGKEIEVSALVRQVTTASPETDEDDTEVEPQAPQFFDTPVDASDTTESDYDGKPVWVENPRAGELAIKFIQSRIPGYVSRRLAIVMLHGGTEQVKEVARGLKNTIDEIVEKLCS